VRGRHAARPCHRVDASFDYNLSSTRKRVNSSSSILYLGFSMLNDDFVIFCDKTNFAIIIREAVYSKFKFTSNCSNLTHEMEYG